MQVYTKKEIEKLLGKNSFFSSGHTLAGKLRYVAGVPAFDEVLLGAQDREVFTLDLVKRPLGYEIALFKMLTAYRIAIHHSTVRSIHLEDREQIFEQRDRSVLGRALVGGLIAGPFGAVVGAMTGIQKSEVPVKMEDLLLTISFYDFHFNTENAIVFSCRYKDRAPVRNVLKI